jgi:hypothetical protein
MGTRLAASTNQNLDKLNRRAGFAIFGHGNDLEKLYLNFRSIATADVSNNLTRVVKSTNRRKVTGGIGKCLDSCKQENCRNALKCKEETPADVRIAIVDEGEAERKPVRYRDT